MIHVQLCIVTPRFHWFCIITLTSLLLWQNSLFYHKGKFFACLLSQGTQHSTIASRGLESGSARVNLVWRQSSCPKPAYCTACQANQHQRIRQCWSSPLPCPALAWPAVTEIPGNVFTCGHTLCTWSPPLLGWHRSCALEWEWCHGILNVRQWRFTAIACFGKHQHQMTYSSMDIPHNKITETNIFI